VADRSAFADAEPRPEAEPDQQRRQAPDAAHQTPDVPGTRADHQPSAVANPEARPSASCGSGAWDDEPEHQERRRYTADRPADAGQTQAGRPDGSAGRSAGRVESHLARSGLHQSAALPTQPKNCLDSEREEAPNKPDEAPSGA
jgi:hypothetical protein